MKPLNKQMETIVNQAFIAFLWILFLMPLYLGFMNTFAKDVIEQPIIVPEQSQTIDEIDNIDELIEENIELTDITIINNSGFIWEEESSFEEAFKMARSLLGPNKTFKWHDAIYHTNYTEEVNLLTTREQEFSQIAE